MNTQRIVAVVAVVCGLAAPASAQPGARGKGVSVARATALVPPDTALVVSIDVAASKRTPLFPRVLQLLELSEELARGLELLRAGADIDARRNVSSAVIAIARDFPKSHRLVYLLDGVFDRAKLAAFSKRDAKAAAALNHRGVTYYRLGGRAEVVLLGKRLVVTRKYGAKEMIDLHLAGRAAKRPGKRLLATVRAADRRAVLWAAFALPSDLQKRVAGKLGGIAIESIAMAANVNRGLRVALALGADTAASGSALAALVKKALPKLAKRDEAKKLGMVGALSGATVSRSRNVVGVSVMLDVGALGGLQKLVSH